MEKGSNTILGGTRKSVLPFLMISSRLREFWWSMETSSWFLTSSYLLQKWLMRPR